MCNAWFVAFSSGPRWGSSAHRICVLGQLASSGGTTSPPIGGADSAPRADPCSAAPWPRTAVRLCAGGPAAVRPLGGPGARSVLGAPAGLGAGALLFLAPVRAAPDQGSDGASDGFIGCSMFVCDGYLQGLVVDHVPLGAARGLTVLGSGHPWPGWLVCGEKARKGRAGRTTERQGTRQRAGPGSGGNTITSKTNTGSGGKIRDSSRENVITFGAATAPGSVAWGAAGVLLRQEGRARFAGAHRAALFVILASNHCRWFHKTVVSVHIIACAPAVAAVQLPPRWVSRRGSRVNLSRPRENTRRTQEEHKRGTGDIH